MCYSHHLTLTVAVHGDIYETRRLNFVWFRETKTLFEFYGNQNSLRQKIDRVRWFPKELPAQTNGDGIYDYFKKLPTSIVWNYIHHPSHIIEAIWNPIGIAKFNYIQTYCQNESTRNQLMRNICKIILKSIIHIQSYAEKNIHVKIETKSIINHNEPKSLPSWNHSA